jgi:MFS family permease
MRAGVFHGWKLVGALMAILFFAAGGSIYVFPVFIGSFQEEFGWSMTQISSGAAIFAVVMGLSNPAVGTLFARLGARRTMLTAAALLALTSLGAGSTVLPAQTLVTNWFNRFRGLAMGLTMLGIGAGGLVLPPFNELLIRLLGWRLTWAVSCGITLVVVIPLIAVFVRTRPSDLGLVPDGANPRDETGEESPPASGLTPRRAVATPTFWLVVGVFVLQLMGVSALNFHFVPLVDQQIGFTPQQAAVFYGLAVGFSIVGRLLFGWLLLFVRLQLREVNLLWLYAVPFGIGSGGNFVVIPVLVGRCFGELHFSKIMGLVMSGSAVGVIVGIPTAGWVFDETGSYEWVLIGCVVGLFLSTLLAVLIRPARHQPQFATEG